MRVDALQKTTQTVSLLAILAAVAGGWYGRWAEAAGFAMSSVSWGFAVVLLPLALVAAHVLRRDARARAALAATTQASMTLAFSVFAFALRANLAELARVPWQVLVVLLGDVVVTTAGLSLAAAGASYALTRAAQRVGRAVEGT